MRFYLLEHCDIVVRSGINISGILSSLVPSSANMAELYHIIAGLDANMA
jgi:hypothetical protein